MTNMRYDQCIGSIQDASVTVKDLSFSSWYKCVLFIIKDNKRGLTFVKAQIFSEFFTKNVKFDLIKFEEKLFENSPYRWRLGVRQTKSFLSSSDLRGDKTNAFNKFPMICN